MKNALVFIFIASLAALVIIIATNILIGSPKEILLTHRSKRLISRYDTIKTKLNLFQKVLVKEHFEDDNYYRTILGLDSLPNTIRDAGTGGSEKYEGFGMLPYSEEIIKLSKKVDAIKSQLKIQEESYKVLEEKTAEQMKKLACIPAITPVAVNDIEWISSYFGVRIDPFTFLKRRHEGIDFVGKKGTKIYATGDGVVTLSRYSRKGYGNEIVIDHGFGYSSRYGHLQKILVNQGQQVKRGQLIGLMGSTGRSTGTHLHYEVMYNGNPIDPIYYYSDDLSGKEYKMIIKLIQDKQN